METNTVLTAEPRSETGKGPAGRLRREGRLPAVYYGRNQEARAITVDAKEFKKVVFSGGGAQNLFRISLDGEEKTVMLKEHQIDPIKRTSVHADFYEVDISRALQIEVPVEMVGKPEGVERGGLLQQIRRVVMISALPANLPDKLVIDVAHLDMGDSFHVDEIQPPEGVEVIYDVNFTVATVIAPKGLKTAEEEEAEEAEAEAAAAEAAAAAESQAGD